MFDFGVRRELGIALDTIVTEIDEDVFQLWQRNGSEVVGFRVEQAPRFLSNVGNGWRGAVYNMMARRFLQKIDDSR